MEWIIWVIVIVLIIAVVWWLLNRNSSTTAGTRDAAGTDQVTPSPSQASTARPRAEAAGKQTAGAGVAEPGIQAAGGAAIAAAAGTAGTGGATRVEEPGQTDTSWPEGTAPARQDSSPTASRPNPEDVEPDIESWDAATPRTAAGTPAPSGGDVDDWDDDEDKAEWETQWSEAGPGTGPGTRTGTAEPRPAAESASAAPAAPVHHPEYTEPHAPTLPGAESAAADALDAEAETQQRMESSAVTEAAASHGAEPAGHEAGPAAAPMGDTPAGEDATGQPYGEGSAAAAADGSGPEGYTVKADAGSMTYYEEDSAGYDEARAEVWFLSPAHAEAAGFRAPRRMRR
ncbi:hypothetical protein [Arthrobacter sp. ISL-28]|uniref:sunset domain-containing protein n=1 Tax=Arthrobacter sp. ISL-28 TaxID=2819108 RepID=UPI001BE8C120|nr:hypothetical protein [Arthrobacter sp. ISL-28]MBT2521242.1 hypothetical protein [Arthrobacter sp. ISL-28]